MWVTWARGGRHQQSEKRKVFYKSDTVLSSDGHNRYLSELN